jgi:hypothetical protein
MASSLLWGFYKMQRYLLTNTYKIVKKNTLAGKKKEGERTMDAF